MTTTTTAISPLRQRMLEDMASRQLAKGTQIGHIRACKRFAAWLKRSPDTATVDEVRLFQLHLMETGTSIQTRNRTMTGLRFLFRVTMRRLDLANEIHHIKEPTRIPQILSAEETARLLAMADNLQTRVLLSIGYGAGLRVSEVVKLKVKHIDTSLGIIVNGSSTRRSPSADQSRCLRTCRATPTASPSRTGGSCPPTQTP